MGGWEHGIDCTCIHYIYDSMIMYNYNYINIINNIRNVHNLIQIR